MTFEAAALFLALTVVAFLYASVGHGGASGYLAVMALAGIAPAVMKPTALVLNLVVAGIGSVQFARAGYFRWRTLWPFALGSIPFAFVGGALRLPVGPYKVVVGAVLLLSAARLFLTATSGFARSSFRNAGFFSAAFDTNVTDVESALPNAPNIGR